LVFYAKNFIPSLMLLALRLRRRFFVVFEAHTIPTTALQRFVVRHVDGVVANSHALARDLQSFGLRKSVLPTHQGVDLTPYATSESRDTIRGRLGLSANELIAVYTGKIYRGYAEVDYIVRAAGAPECRNIRFILVGGREDHVADWRRELEKRDIHNVTFTGFVSPADVHEYQLAADFLLLYYPSGMVLNKYRSPGKLFGYMASGVPIVSVDLQVLREVLGDPPAAVLVPPDSSIALARALQYVATHPEVAITTAAEARQRVAAFTWDKRAESILSFIERLQRMGSASMVEGRGAGEAG
jgi:glycosyltransferase involved in cell wall biosynthesis